MTQPETPKGKRPGAVRVWLLGGFRVAVGSRTTEDRQWRLRKAAALVKLLSLAQGHRLQREQVMDLLWPDLGKKAASNSLRQALHAARRALAPDPTLSSTYLGSKDESLVLCPEVPLWVDVEALEEAAASARRSRDPAAYRVALDLYAGELLPGDRYEEWAEERREQLRRLYLELLVELAGLYEERDEYGLAIEALRKAAAKEPTLQEAQASLMRLYTLAGRPEQALAQYERLRDTLSRGLGTEPGATTRRLRDEIVAGRFSTTRPAAPPPQEEELPGADRHNLPAQRTSFVGREREMVQVKRMLAMTRLLTLTGAGGTGKTRLALEVTRDLIGAYPDGVWLVELAPLSEPELVAQEVAGALEVPERPGQPLTDTLVDALRAKHMLLVVDNCEHLVEAAAQLVDALLDSCPRLRVLATSREPLDLGGEVLWQVSSLSLPAATDGEPDGREGVESLMRYEAVRLFVDRARLRLPDFELAQKNAGAVARVCRKLDGIPLAIELATARMRSLAVEQVAQRLEASLDVLKGASRSEAPRHQTLRATLDWSYDLLSAAERAVFGRLSVFAGGWTLEAAEAVSSGGGIEEDNVLYLLGGLVDKSLAVAVGSTDEAVRYRMLEPIRQYAREKLEESRETQAIQRRHAAFFLDLAKEAEPGLTGAQQQAWVVRLEAEYDNLREALSWSLENEPHTALRLATALARFWEISSHFLEGSRWLEEALRRNGSAEAAARAKALTEAGTFAHHRGQYDQATVLHGEALDLYQELGDEHGVAFALLCLGVQKDEQGDHERAKPLFEEALALSRKTGDKRTISYAIHNLAEVARLSGDYERAKTLGMEAFAVYREMDDKWMIARILGWLGILSVYNIDDREAAAGFLREGLALNQKIGNWEYVAFCLEGFAGLAGAKGEGVRAARLWGAADALRRTIGSPFPGTDRPYFERSMAAARDQLDGAAWEAAWEQGRAISSEEAVEYALSGEEPALEPASLVPEEPPTSEPMDMLTPREQEIALLVARGLTNRRISSRLGISERTASNHVARVLRKLGLSSRVQLATWATERR